MTVLYVLSFISLLIQICFVTVAIGKLNANTSFDIFSQFFLYWFTAAGLYYLAELVEEYTVASRKIISTLIILTILIHILILIFDRHVPWVMVMSGLLAQVLHGIIIRNFPYVNFLSIPFIGAVILLFANHYLAFSYFSSNYHTFSEVMAYFIVCMWLVPFSLFVSLSANDNVLPTVNEKTSLLNSNNKQDDVVSNYFSKRGKRVGLLQLFNYARESLLPTRNKKSF